MMNSMISSQQPKIPMTVPITQLPKTYKKNEKNKYQKKNKN